MGEGHLLCIAGRIRGLIEADLGLIRLGRPLAPGDRCARDVGRLRRLPRLRHPRRIELMLGNLEAAAGILRDLLPWFLALGIVDPTEAAWADTIETFVALGQPEVIRDLFDQWETQARALASPLSRNCPMPRAARRVQPVTSPPPMPHSRSRSTSGRVALSTRSAPARFSAGVPYFGEHSNVSPLGKRSEHRSRSSTSSGPVCGAPGPERRSLASAGRRPAAVRLTNAEREVSELAGTGPEQQGDRGVTPHGSEHGRIALVERVPQARRASSRAGSCAREAQ